jgi:hypothetical protein
MIDSPCPLPRAGQPFSRDETGKEIWWRERRERKEKGHSPREQSLSEEGVATRAFALADAFLQMEEELAERVLVLERSDPERKEEVSAEIWQGLKPEVSGKVAKKRD